MRKLSHPYQIFFILVALVAMIFLLKINKRNFYHHYFKVIEEVELRNSQEVFGLQDTVLFTSTRPVIESLITFLSFLSVGFILISFYQKPVLRSKMFELSVKPLVQTRPFYFTPPIRAPQHIFA